MLTRVLALIAFLLLVGAVFAAGRALRDRVTGRDTSDRPPAWRDVRVLQLAAQVVVIGLLLTLASWLWANFQDRTELIGLDLDFSFLDQPSGISIADNPLSANAPIRDALLQGIKNTLFIILVGIPLSVVLGTLIGVARLSTNWLLRKLATAYVEFFRNIPPLLVIVFVWAAVFLRFPPATGPVAEKAWRPFSDYFIFSNSRFAFPSVVGRDNFGGYQVLVVFAILLAIAAWVWRTRLFNSRGVAHRRTAWSLGVFVVIATAGYAALGAPFEISRPMVVDRLWVGGFRMQMPYVTVMLALAIYTASHVAEIVRGSIQAVHRGQVEAAHALALNGFQRYRFVVLPQAFRIAFPPLINQFLNYTKNTSLAVAIGFAEVTSITQNLFGQSQPAPQLLLILMVAYLTFSLVLSLIGNIINRRLQLVGR